VEPKVADGACVTAAPRFFQFANDLHRPNFGCAGDSSRRKGRSNCVKHATTATQTAHYVGHDMHYVAVALDLHELCHSNGAEFRHSTHIIACQINQHDVLGALLRICQQLRSVGFILRWSESSRARPCDWANLHCVTSQPDMHLG